MRAKLALIASLLVGSFPTVSAIAGTQCFGREPTIVGTEGRDKLEGTQGSDVIVGLGDTDKIYGFGGDDFICAGSGERQLPDEETGGTYSVGDNAYGGGGNDHIDGQGDVDSLWGQGGDDEILSSAGGGYLDGGDGFDAIEGGSEFEQIRGRAAGDLIHTNGGADGVDAGSGHDEIVADDGDNEVVAGRGNDEIDAGAGDDEIYSQQGDDVVGGGPGRDLLNLFWVECGSGCMSSHRINLVVDLREGYARGMGTDILDGIEDVWGSAGFDRLAGDDGPNELGGTDDQGIGSDSNVLKGRGGNDRLLAGTGDDRIYGGEGPTLSCSLEMIPPTK